MKLCDKDIKYLIDSGNLIINPRPNYIHSASIDLNLGNNFRIFKNKSSINHIDLNKSILNIESVLDDLTIKKVINNKNIFLRPKEFVLAETLEYIKLPNNIVGWLNGKSSLARIGLIVHITSNRIDPGWNGNIILELYNVGYFTINMRPNIPICAVSFDWLSVKNI